ncbi:hypothetical protein [Hyphomicrobium sp.]|jgi:hypothetical protein|uniref:hypothetical protein n=1 Tax=Hyphomicrobium sp. TaxID=82 RepID=UPI002C45F996|nr:hypothetical protein [Hyphomicrobium sp.]HVZ05175.1 hypothetical protein [Hyphomicrobium sp.]
MATVITVHGTFAKPTEPDPDGGVVEPQWWETQSAFEHDLRELVEARDGRLDVKAFVWPGDNSEVERRRAGAELANILRGLEARSEPYCIIGHSHGGSIVSFALLESAARRKTLPNLKRWITVGTPFINLRKELWLLTRLSLVRKVVFVASMMLLMMLLIYQGATIFTGDRMLFGGLFPRVQYWTIAFMSMPAIAVYFLFSYLDRRAMLDHRRGVMRRARENFAARWRALSHPDDEAIQGLALLPDARLTFFDKSFAVSTITLISVVALPLIYLAALFSPPTIVGLSNWLYTNVYAVNLTSEVEADMKALRDDLAAIRRSRAVEKSAAGAEGAGQPAQDRSEMWRQYRQKRKSLAAKYSNFSDIERAMRFRQRFLEKDGQPCEGGIICGAGHDLTYNSGLLLHLVTDELSWVLGADDVRGASYHRLIWSLAVPLVVTPIIFGLIALLLMATIHALASIISGVSSKFLNGITNSEVKRAGFGNDTEGEVVLGAADRPSWLDRSQPRLSAPIADLVTNYSNAAASQSIAKFRQAIGQIRFAVPPHTADTAISTYFTWKELVHASYFDVPEFRKLIAQVISRADGFTPSERFLADPDYQKTAEWLAAIEQSPGTAELPSDHDPTPKDARAVAAVVTSTVKAQP